MEIERLTDLKWYRLSLGPGAVLHRSLKEFLEREKLQEAYVVSCVGSCTTVVAVYPTTADIPPQLGKTEFEGLFEINGIGGDVKRRGNEIRVHLHGSLTHKGTNVFGGALQEGTTIFKMADLILAGR
ncbi:MAG: DNA-binding protein [Desulfobacterales bacterium]|jgi:predicted DNA-binding protein with PD1-like motif|nr:DNA-binding protein [Desulfobacterales bacterium]